MNSLIKKASAYTLVLSMTTACVPVRPDGPSPDHGLGTAAVGFAHLILSPFMIVAGLVEGIASLPYFLAHGLHDLNQGLAEANASITLDDTYESAYGRHLQDVPDDGRTGVVFQRMQDATAHFQRILRQYGVPDTDRYLLTAIRTADRDGYTLYAVIYRPEHPVRVIDKLNGHSVRSFTRADRLFYQPHRRDAKGQPLDVVIDWAGVSRDAIRTQKGQAILMTLAANSILNNKRTPEYWDVEKRWVDGDYQHIVAQRSDQLRKRMGIDEASAGTGRRGGRNDVPGDYPVIPRRQEWKEPRPHNNAGYLVPSRNRRHSVREDRGDEFHRQKSYQTVPYVNRDLWRERE